ncbi:type IV secretion system DNA-binding domain-containing protein [Candidatus Parcubacteria bacterium]|nr:type IV secretion system DNA-binding domain-containing protein [Candidatus Parcubacteria bacterium]
MAAQNDPITYFAETDSRNKRVPFGIKASDRTRHVYVIGKTGMGKSTLLENMAVQDIKNGEGLAFIDPHGKTADLLLEYVPQERIKDVIYFAPFDLEHPISFNVMEDVGYERRHLVASGLMSAFKKIWVDAWSARMEYILNNILLALLEYPDSTLIGVNRMLSDKDYRNKVVENISDPSVKAFWTDEFAKYGDRYMQEAGAAIQNKIGQFVSNPLVRNIIGQPKSTFDIRKIMDEKKILIINLSKGRVGEANANLLGSMLITKIYLGALSRADVSETVLKKQLPNFYLYVDEFQSFANESFADILSEARKYKLNLTIAHQYIEQMSEEVRFAVFGNVGTMVVFRVGAYDAEFLEKEFFPTFTKEDLVSLGFVQTYLKLMIDGVTSPPFSATTLPPIEKPLISFKEDIIKNSREVYTRPQMEVQDEIKKWHEPIRIEGRDDKRRISQPSPRNTEQRNPEPMRPMVSSMPKPTVPKREAQEMDLRKAIAESYKKNVPERKDLTTQPKKDKGPTPQNMSALRSVLAQVIKEEKPKEPTPQVPKPSVQRESRPEPKQEAKAKPNEVPEEVLRKILEIEQ